MLIAPKLFGVNIYFDHRNKGFLWFLFYLRKEVKKMKYKVVVTAGGTSEKIDNVRKITNSSSGKLGYTITNKLIQLHEEQIEKIYYI